MCIALTAASWDIKTAHIIQYKVTAYFMDFLFIYSAERGERVSQQRFKDFNQSPEYQWGISPTYLQRRNAYKMR